MFVVDDLHKSFGQIRAVDGVSLRVERGEVLGVMGVNGAGKSTLLDCVCGFLRPDRGSITFDGRTIVGREPHEIGRLGLGRTFQVPRSFRGLTVMENLLVVPQRGRSGNEMAVIAERALAQVRLAHLCENYAEELSGGQQKLLELARILMIEPGLILMDEPFAGMHPELCRVFIEEVEALAARGVAIVMVCHDPGTLYRLSRRIIVMNQGRIISEGPPEQIKADPVVIDAYLGTAH